MLGHECIVVPTFSIIHGDGDGKQLPPIVLMCALIFCLYILHITYTDYNYLLTLNILIMRKCSSLSIMVIYYYA